MEIIIIIVIVMGVVGWLAYEMIIAPIMPDDYTNEPNDDKNKENE